MIFCTLDQGKSIVFVARNSGICSLRDTYSINHVASFTQKVKIPPLHLHYQNLQFKNLF